MTKYYRLTNQEWSEDIDLKKEELAKMPAEEVSKLFHKKQIECKTCAQFGQMIFNGCEYIMIKEQVIENLKKIIISRRTNNEISFNINPTKMVRENL